MRNYKKYLASFLIVLSSFSSTYSAFASPLDTPMGGWNISGGIAQGASTLYQATKNALINGKNVQKTSSVLVAPVPAKVIKVLVEGGAFLALSVAVDQLLGAVDFVLDPENNQIKYWEDVGMPYFFGELGSDVYAEGKTREEACKMYATAYNKKFGSNSTLYYYSTVGVSGVPSPTSDYYCYLSKMVYSTISQNAVRVEGKINVAELGSTEGEVKTYPIPALADYIIKKAEEGNTTAQQATMTAAAQTIAEAETDSVKAAPLVQQLEANAVTPTSETATGTATQTETKTDSTTGETTTQEKLTDLKLTFPKACEWAPSFCEAAAVVITFPITVTKWWETANTKSETWADAISQAWADTKEWATSENKDENTELDFDQQEEATDTTISFDHSCPAPIPVPISWNGHSVDFSFSFDMFCTAMSTYVKPIVIAMGAFHAVLIVSGVRLNG